MLEERTGTAPWVMGPAGTPDSATHPPLAHQARSCGKKVERTGSRGGPCTTCGSTSLPSEEIGRYHITALRRATWAVSITANKGSDVEHREKK